ncbi:hypothetical protein Tco_1051716, partial [Tanacetum coccineum]
LLLDANEASSVISNNQSLLSMDSTFIHDDEEELQAASTNALTEADKRAKAAVVAGGTNTLSNHKLLHPFH